MSVDADFKQFVERQHRASAENSIDWNKQRDDWLFYLQQLYRSIAEYLEDYIRDGAIELLTSDIELNEEDIGVYTATRLSIKIGAQEILLTPIGTLLIGSKGRVDVKGSAGSSRLVLINKKITNPGQMVRVRVAAIPPGGSTSPPPPPPEPQSPEKIEWAWKIVSRPPAMEFIELNKDSLFEMLMEVSNG